LPSLLYLLEVVLGRTTTKNQKKGVNYENKPKDHEIDNRRGAKVHWMQSLHEGLPYAGGILQ
jgi:hypothetical protein